jgi:tetratricopeptide (TPR) repeat protein
MIPERSNRIFLISYLILVSLYLLHLAPLFFTESRMWGFNHLIFLPPTFAVVFMLISIILLALPFLPFTKKWGERLVAGFIAIFYESRRKYLYRLIFISFMVVMFIIFRAPTHFLGDGYSLIANLGSLGGTFLKATEKGVTMILLGIQSLYGPKNQETSLWAFQTVSIISGAITIWFFFLIAGVISAEKMRRFLSFGAMVGSGVLLLFFGYTENYPMLWTAAVGFIYFGLHHLKTGRGFIWAGLFLALGLFIHLQMAIFVPAFVYMIFARGKGLRFYRTYRTALWGIGGLVILAGSFLFIRQYNANLYIQNMFLPFISGKPVDPDYAVFSLPHIADLINLMMLLSPAFLLFLIWAIMSRPFANKKESVIFLGLLALGGLVFIIIIDPTLGMTRDWDLFSMGGIGFTLLLTALIGVKCLDIAGRLLLPLAALLIIAPALYLTSLLNEPASVQHAKYMVNLDEKKSYSTLYTLHTYYKDRGDSAAADSVNLVGNIYYPDMVKMTRAAAALENGDSKTAMQIAATITSNKFSWKYHHLLSASYFIDRNFQLALEEADRALQLEKYNYQIYATRGMIFIALKQYDKALYELRLGYNLNSRHPLLLQGLTGLFYYRHIYDSCIYYAEKLLAIDSADFLVPYFLSKTYIDLGQIEPALEYKEKYGKFGSKDAYFIPRKQELENLTIKLKSGKIK